MARWAVAATAKRSSQQVLERDLLVMDAAAISLCRDNDLPIVIFNLERRGNIRRVVAGERVGSIVRKSPAAG